MEELRSMEVNGVRLHFLDTGAPEGKNPGPEPGAAARPVILLHGNGESHEIFEMEIRQLTEAGYRVIAPDTRGHGANEPLTEYHYADMAEDIYQLITALDLDHPALYGFSDGGITGLLLELSHPGTLGLLAISGTNLSPAGLEPSFVAEYASQDADPLVHLMLTEPRIDPAALKKIRIPVLVTAGTDDLILREETERIAAHLPASRLVILEGEDHGSYVIGSEKMGELLLEFLKAQGYGAY